MIQSQEREELAAAAIASAYVMCVRLVERGRSHRVFVSPLARWGVRHALSWRSVGNRRSSLDITSRYCQQRYGLQQLSLDSPAVGTDQWREVIIEDRSTSPAETAIARLDFNAWLKSLPPQKRSVAEELATGESTSEVARHFRLTPGRISQIRRELETDWQQFQCEAC